MYVDPNNNDELRVARHQKSQSISSWSQRVKWPMTASLPSHVFTVLPAWFPLSFSLPFYFPCAARAALRRMKPEAR